ncbi:cation:proton antiporter domain-containing protein [Prochlorothrix hollandica]|uniref:Sodium:proton antiporter n=1 Tax=Prochlorothrix hollandica PCC 9006 = CALU 1027 TaxID=317619 RepID=A0A0M2PX44_PROHO|nr:cation:proton antiporter [Prochlorothrix hollandica]KKJ01001.1 sodium:proton antiporter [Prochlorothrix hollandica PCC 9006 = CALU 1027]
MSALIHGLPDSPIVGFTALLLAILTVPPLVERLRLPGLVGLLAAGIMLGGNGLGLISSDDAGMALLSDIGKIYLMFVAGLEIDLAEFRKTQNRSLGFGAATFFIPLIFGTIMGRSFNFGWNGSILIGSLLASHTLLGFPIVRRLGVVRTEAVTVTVGATIVTDTAALLVLAICVAIHGGSFTGSFLVKQLILLGAYAVAVLWGLDWAGREYFKRTGDEEGNQFLFVLFGVFLAAIVAQMINVDKIVGAFLAGLAINDALGKGPVQEKVEFLGSTLFIPFFFIDMGLLIDIPRFIDSLVQNPLLTIALSASLISSKFLASLVCKVAFRYNWAETITMWSLSLPQVAATLAATLVGVQVGLLGEEIFNGVIVMMLVTSILGPLLTERFAAQLTPPLPTSLPEPDTLWFQADALVPSLTAGVPVPDFCTLFPEDDRPHPFTVLVPLANPSTEQGLIELAALVAQQESGTIVPLKITKAHVNMADPQLDQDLLRGRRILRRAVDLCQGFGVTVDPVLRIDDDVAAGITHAAREHQADLIVMGWSRFSLRSRLLGTVTEAVFWAAHCPVAVTRLVDNPQQIQRILVPVKDLLPRTLRTVRFAQWLGETNGGTVVLLHICVAWTPPEQITAFETSLNQWVEQQSGTLNPGRSGGETLEPNPGATVQVTTLTGESITGEEVASIILNQAQQFDLVVLRSVRRRTAGGFAVSTVTNQVMDNFGGSIVLFGEPHG